MLVNHKKMLTKDIYQHIIAIYQQIQKWRGDENMSAVKKKENAQEIREIITIFKALDPMSKLLLQNSAKTLLMRDQMTEQDKKHLVQQ